jgi:hypothetical protein
MQITDRLKDASRQGVDIVAGAGKSQSARSGLGISSDRCSHEKWGERPVALLLKPDYDGKVSEEICKRSCSIG